MSAIPPTDPSALKKIEKTIEKEAKAEEKHVQQVLKDLHSTEKADAKATKAVSKAQNNLGKAEKNEESTLKAASKAAYKHDLAATELHKAENDLRLKQQQNAKIHHNLESVKVQADEAKRQKEAHEQTRQSKLIGLLLGEGGSSSAGATGAGGPAAHT
jgi:hypothetical protein